MFVEGTSEVNSKQLAMKQSHPYDSTSKPEVAQMVRVDVRIAVGLDCGSCSNGSKEFKQDQTDCTLTDHQGTE